MEARIKGGATIWARQTVDSCIFTDKPHVWFKIWFYLINRVNHETNKLFERGECFVKYDWIEGHTKASKSEIDHCLRWLKSATMIATRKATRGMILKVLKYDTYQTLDNYYSDIKSDDIGDLKAKQKRNKSDTINKNDKNDNNEKNDNNKKDTNPKGLQRSSADGSFGNPDINKVTEYFEKQLGGKLDGSVKQNRQYAKLLLDGFNREYKDDIPATTRLCGIIQAALRDTFHAKNATSFRYLYNNRQKIIQTAKQSFNNPKVIKI